MHIKKILVSIVLLALVGGTCAAVAVFNLWNKPLGPSLDLPGRIGEVLANPSSNSSEPSNPEAQAKSPSLISKFLDLFNKDKASSGGGQCNGPQVMTILLIGSDERKNDYLYGLSDSIRLVRVDFTNASVMMVDIPRDLWVEIPGISDHYNITHGKLNQAYFFGNPGMGYYDGPGNGPGLLARTLDQNFGVRVDHYLAVDMTTFVRIVDTIGGIDVQLGESVDFNPSDAEPHDPEKVLAAGEHHLDGEQALALARNRTTSIFQRARYQSIVLKGVQKKLLSPSTLPKLPGLVKDFSSAVLTDLSPNEVNQLMCIGKKMTDESTQTVAFPDDMFTGQSTYDPYRNVNTYTLAADFALMRQYFADFMQGTWPAK